MGYTHPIFGRVMTGSECMEAAKEYERLLEAQVRALDDFGILLGVHGGIDYHIKWDRIDTPEKGLVWVLHLLEKNWVTSDMVHRVINLCENHFGWKLPWNC